MCYTHVARRFLSYLRADGVFLPSTVPDAPVHGEIEGEEFEWNDTNAHAGPEAPCDDIQNYDLTEVQNAIAGVSSSSVVSSDCALLIYVFLDSERALLRLFCFQALQELSPGGHGAFLKTNWSAPKDASFVIGNNVAVVFII